MRARWRHQQQCELTMNEATALLYEIECDKRETTMKAKLIQALLQFVKSAAHKEDRKLLTGQMVR